MRIASAKEAKICGNLPQVETIGPQSSARLAEVHAHFEVRRLYAAGTMTECPLRGHVYLREESVRGSNVQVDGYFSTYNSKSETVKTRQKCSKKL